VSFSGDFGTAARPGLDGSPAIFCYQENLGGGDAVATSDPVPEGETWVVVGWGFWSQCDAPGSVWGVLFGPTSVVLAGKVIDVQVFGPLDDTASPGAGDTVPSFAAYLPGQRIEVQCHATTSSTNCSASAWGIVLPYVSITP
jgi:hypothetical protein